MALASLYLPYCILLNSESWGSKFACTLTSYQPDHTNGGR